MLLTGKQPASMTRIVDGPHVVKWVAERAGIFDPGAAVGLGVERNGELIAGVIFNDFNGASACIHVASDGSKCWLNRDFLFFVFHYAFEQVKVKRLTGIVAEGNTAARKFDEHLGFVEECRLKDAHPTGDLIIYRMFLGDCRFLKRERK